MDPLSFMAGGALVVFLLLGKQAAEALAGPLCRVDGIDLPSPDDESWKISNSRHGRYLVHPNKVKVYVGMASGPVISVDRFVLEASFAAYRYRKVVHRRYLDRVAHFGKSGDPLLGGLSDDFDERLRLAEAQKGDAT